MIVACAAAAATTAAAARGRSYINHRAEASTEPDCCLGKPSYVGIIENVIVPRGIILLTLQLLIDRSIKLEMMFTEYVWGFNHI